MHLTINDRTKIIYSMYRAGEVSLTPSMLREAYPTLLPWRGRYDLSRQMLPHSPRMVAVCLLARSMLIKMYYHFMVYACTCTMYNCIYSRSISPISDFLQNGGLTDWEVAPSSYDLQSSGSPNLNEYLKIFYPHESFSANNLILY